ncbi:hypothetical protein [Myxococcus sp. SDU36]|uniref:hypothetical protein n=1 Tax=Myxococcus sp. SDU36 TaxID=2831967 RepID=UPI002542C9EC|nr:hypothetical protein [Myxococcus sp. SDU36]WIG94647.1 hypothetical protein KGD87_29660 [Myxococcus sp. SDU36]
MATSEDNSVQVTQSGAPFALTTEQIKTTRHVTVRIAPQSYELSTSLFVTTGITAQWVPDTPVPGQRPTLQVQWPVVEPHGNSHRERILLAENDTTPVEGAAYSHHDIRCDARQECVWEGELEFSIDSENPGTVDMQAWSVEVSIDPNSGKRLSERDISIVISER